MWRRVDIVLTDVSEERMASIFRVEEKRRKNPRARNLLTLDPRSKIFLLLLLLAPAHAGSSLVDFSSTLKTAAIRSSETSGNTISTWRHIPDLLHSHRRENLKSYIKSTC
jgi:hypothetical protein